VWSLTQVAPDHCAASMPCIGCFSIHSDVAPCSHSPPSHCSVLGSFCPDSQWWSCSCKLVSSLEGFCPPSARLICCSGWSYCDFVAQCELFAKLCMRLSVCPTTQRLLGLPSRTELLQRLAVVLLSCSSPLSQLPQLPVALESTLGGAAGS